MEDSGGKIMCMNKKVLALEYRLKTDTDKNADQLIIDLPSWMLR